MIALSCLIGLFLMVYTEQHGPYMNILDVMLMTTAAAFILLIVIGFIATKNK